MTCSGAIKSPLRCICDARATWKRAITFCNNQLLEKRRWQYGSLQFVSTEDSKEDDETDAKRWRQYGRTDGEWPSLSLPRLYADEGTVTTASSAEPLSTEGAWWLTEFSLVKDPMEIRSPEFVHCSRENITIVSVARFLYCYHLDFLSFRNVENIVPPQQGTFPTVPLVDRRLSEFPIKSQTRSFRHRSKGAITLFNWEREKWRNPRSWHRDDFRKCSKYGKPSVANATARRKLEGSHSLRATPLLRNFCRKRRGKKKGRRKTQQGPADLSRIFRRIRKYVFTSKTPNLIYAVEYQNLDERRLHPAALKKNALGPLKIIRETKTSMTSIGTEPALQHLWKILSELEWLRLAIPKWMSPKLLECKNFDEPRPHAAAPKSSDTIYFDRFLDGENEEILSEPEWLMLAIPKWMSPKFLECQNFGETRPHPAAPKTFTHHLLRLILRWRKMLLDQNLSRHFQKNHIHDIDMDRATIATSTLIQVMFSCVCKSAQEGRYSPSLSGSAKWMSHRSAIPDGRQQ
ncbi:hypothetical protein J6590_064868 [Homalodisca vitripennis]|nr:hypothetical protein J6590_064868 [Homalodisca vitripennis]